VTSTTGPGRQLPRPERARDGHFVDRLAVAVEARVLDARRRVGDLGADFEREEVGLGDEVDDARRDEAAPVDLRGESGDAVPGRLVLLALEGTYFVVSASPWPRPPRRPPRYLLTVSVASLRH
jgi:hypothetical protein